MILSYLSIVITILVIIGVVFSLVITHNLKHSLALLQTQTQSLRETLLHQLTHMQQAWSKELTQQQYQLNQSMQQLKEQIQQDASTFRSLQQDKQLEQLTTLQRSMQQNFADVRQQLLQHLNQQSTLLNQRVSELTQQTQHKLSDISTQVDQRLAAGFEKTNATFTDIIKRLAIIDQAQQKITDLSQNVVSLQEILADKRSRGAFGEVQLAALIRNLMPSSSFALQYTLSNNKRADCILFLPAPTGHIVIDAKFPLESYQRLQNLDLTKNEQRTWAQQFKQDLRKHIQDISNKYIISGETSDGAVMFIPAEAIFADIHAHHPDIIQFAHSNRVWLTSPTTMMAILTTARGVLKDAATRKQIHIIQEHLGFLAKDFGRFQKRMDNLSKHISQAHQDVEAVHASAKKISSRFLKIEQAEVSKIESDTTTTTFSPPQSQSVTATLSEQE